MAFELLDQSSSPTFEPRNERNSVSEVGGGGGAEVSGIRGGSFRVSGLILQPP